MREVVVRTNAFTRKDLELPKPLGVPSKKVWRLAVPLAFLAKASPFFASKHPELISRILSTIGNSSS